MLGFFAAIISISAIFGYVNHKWLKLPATIGVMLISVLLGISMKLAVAFFGADIPLALFLSSFNFSSFVLDFILCFLLFAGSLHVNFTHLKGARSTVFSYSTLGVIISTLVTGILSHLIISGFGYEVSFMSCFLFGALISPTDPIAVIGILSQYNLPRKLKTEIVGESLFNDGVGVVVFTVIYVLLNDKSGVSAGRITEVFATEVIGGISIGLITGYAGYYLMKSIDHYQTEVMITLAVVTGGYSLASYFHSSGPLAMVVAGLLIGNKGKEHAMSDLTAEYVDKFWELVDEICNTVLFVLMGLQIFLIPFKASYLLIGIILIAVTLVGRYISLLPAFFIFNRAEQKKGLSLMILTWGGLRGGISVALALSLTGKIPFSELFIVCTYCIVLFSILVQGITIKQLLKRY